MIQQANQIWLSFLTHMQTYKNVMPPSEYLSQWLEIYFCNSSHNPIWTFAGGELKATGANTEHFRQRVNTGNLDREYDHISKYTCSFRNLKERKNIQMCMICPL